MFRIHRLSSSDADFGASYGRLKFYAFFGSLRSRLGCNTHCILV